MTDMRTLNSGFTVIELCLGIFALSVLASLGTGYIMRPDNAYYEFPRIYLLRQSQALAAADDRYLDYEGLPAVRFHANGNIDRPSALQVGRGGRVIVMELGGGRLVFR